MQKEKLVHHPYSLLQPLRDDEQKFVDFVNHLSLEVWSESRSADMTKVAAQLLYMLNDLNTWTIPIPDDIKCGMPLSRFQWIVHTKLQSLLQLLKEIAKDDIYTPKVCDHPDLCEAISPEMQKKISDIVSNFSFKSLISG